MNIGSEVHEAFESLDLKNPNLSLYDNALQKYISNFILSDLLKNINQAKIFKEYEFIDEVDNEMVHGIIDLMLEYDDHIDIIDYKLSHIDDEAYVVQLGKYKKYISSKTTKKVNIYLYSILKNVYKKLED